MAPLNHAHFTRDFSTANLHTSNTSSSSRSFPKVCSAITSSANICARNQQTRYTVLRTLAITSSANICARNQQTHYTALRTLLRGRAGGLVNGG